MVTEADIQDLCASAGLSPLLTRRMAASLVGACAGSDVSPRALAEQVVAACQAVRGGAQVSEHSALLALAGLKTSDLDPALHDHHQTRVGIFGWGLIGPGAPDVDSFLQRVRAGASCLTPMEGYGPSNFYAGVPSFDFADYREWIEQRHGPTRYAQLDKKMGLNVKYALGVYIQALRQDPRLEQTLRELGDEAHIYVTTAQGDIPLEYGVCIEYYRAQRIWNRFWAGAEQCQDRQAYEALSEPGARQAMLQGLGAPPDPAGLHDAEPDFEAAHDAWNSFWAARSERLQQYLQESREVHDRPLGRDVEKDKASAIKARLQGLKRLRQAYQCPPEPWASVSQRRLWNIDNIPAAQIGMVGGITGPHIAAVDACTSFIVNLHLALEAIRNNRAKAVIIGATDPAPNPINVGTFYDAKVLTCDGKVSRPLAHLKGTHVSGGAVLWILGDLDYMVSRGHRPLGVEPVVAVLNSDAEHIITPSQQQPRRAIQRALEAANITPQQVETFDLHATATPGDWAEVENVHAVLGDTPYLTARKGIFGHGMAAGGGWELTAQYLGMEAGWLFRVSDEPFAMNDAIAAEHPRFVTHEDVPYRGGYAGKISMGVGGINGVAISRPLRFDLYVHQLAALAGLTTAEVLDRIAAGELEARHDAQGLLRVSFDELRRWEREARR